MYRHFLTGSAFAALLAGSAAAQTTTQPADAVSEVVVTATRRSESLQNVAASVTAVGQEQLDRADITDIRDVIKQVPGIADGGVAQGGVSRFSIRGIATQTGSGDDPISTYVDGVYMGKPGTGVSDLVDVSSVQILRGPQGSLYGRNATGGAIVVTTNDPVFNREGEIRASYGSFQRRRLEGVLNIPLIDDKLAVRAAVSANKQKGWGVNEFDGTTPNGVDNLIYRLSVRFDPNANARLVLRAQHEDRHAYRAYKRINSVAVNSLAPYTDYFPFTGQGATAVTRPGVTGPFASVIPTLTPTTRTPAGTTNENFLYPATDKNVTWIQHNPAWQELRDFKRNREDREGDAVSLNAEFDIGDLLLKSVTGWQRVDLYDMRDTDNLGPTSDGGSGSPLTSINNANENYWQWVHSTSLQKDTGRLRWVAGVDLASSLDENSFHNRTATQNSYNRIDTRTKSAAIFGDVEYDLTDTLVLGVGLRGSYEKKKGTRRNVACAANVFNEFDPTCPVTPDLDAAGKDLSLAQKSWTNVSPAVRLQYKPSEDLMVYGSVSTGFKSGGFSRQLGNLPFEPETVVSYELGAKARMGRMLRGGVSIFRADYSDMQVQTALEPSITRTINAKKARSEGVEFEGEFRPGYGLYVAGTAGYVKAQYLDFLEGVGVAPATGTGNIFYLVPRDGNQIQRAPKQTYSARAGWSHDFDFGRLEAEVNYTFRDVIFTTSDNSIFRSLDRRELTGARLSWTAVGGAYGLALTGSNLTNDRSRVGMNRSSNTTNVIFEEPRSYNVELFYRF